MHYFSTQNSKIKMNLLLKLLLIVLISVQCTHCMPFLVNLCHDSETSEFCSETNDYPVKVSSDIWKKTLCEFCFLTLPIARDLIDTNRTKYFHDIAMHLCEDLKISNSIVCNMAVSEYEVNKTIMENMHIRIMRKWASLFFRIKLP